MFSNLIESGSHTADLKRKVRFFFGTTLFYGLLLAATGVGSIYAYNVRLDYNPDYEVLALMRFQPAESRAERPRREQPRAAAAAASSPSRPNSVATRTEISMQTPYHGERIASADTPEVLPGQAARIGTFNSTEVGGPTGPYTPGVPGLPGGKDEGPAVTETVEPPPPRVTPTPAPAPTPRSDKPVALSSSIIAGKTLAKPAPPYPAIAKAAGVQGAVAVQILVDERGHVVSAKATSGNPLLQRAAVEAAYKALFSPTVLGGQPVKVTGSITYNFMLR
jgi:protein TonB